MGQAVRRIDLDGLSLTLTRYPKLQRQPLHEHESATFFLLMHGEFIDSPEGLEGKCLDRMAMVFHPPDLPHACEAGPKGRAGLNIEPSGAWLSKYGISVEEFGSYRVVDSPSCMLPAIKLILSGEASGYSVQLQDQVLDLLTACLQGSEDCEDFGKWFRVVEEYVEDVEPRSLSLAEAATQASVHPVYLARVFRRKYGCSLGDYSLRKRLCQASEAVLREGKSLGEAAHQSAFSDQAHFSRMFRRELGVTPKSLLSLRRELLQ